MTDPTPTQDTITARLEGLEPCRMCEGRGGVSEAQGEGVHVGLKCPKCHGFGSEWIVDFISDALDNSMGPEWNTRLGAQYVADMLSDLGFAVLLSERATLKAELEEARGVLSDAETALQHAADTFYRYARLHQAKATNEGDAKACANASMGEEMHRALEAARAYLTKEPTNG